ncbi:uncharacterized protein [Dermacentor albipictus]|uniref:uncharacterized protein n=1 Tax=Dermacentor albipictus TaxID=60249 RepID=UPI0038FCD9BE
MSAVVVRFASADDQSAPCVTASDAGVEGASQSSEVQHSYQLRSRIQRPPNAFMLSAHGKRRSVAAENPNENNQRMSIRLMRGGRSCRRPQHADCVYNTREGQRCQGQERSSELTNGTCRDQEQQPSISMAMAQDRGTPEFQQQQHPPPPPQRSERRATSAAQGSDLGVGQGMPLPRPSATVTATASAGSSARPYNMQRFPGLLPTSQSGGNRENSVPTTQLMAVRAFKQPKTPYALTMLDNQLSPTLLDD